MSYFFLDEYEHMESYVPGEMPKDRDYLKKLVEKILLIIS